MDWEQFNSIMQTRIIRKKSKGKMEEPAVDVEDWMEYFGIDDSSQQP